MTTKEELAYESGYRDGYFRRVKDKDPTYPTWYNNGYKKGLSESPTKNDGRGIY